MKQRTEAARVAGGPSKGRFETSLDASARWHQPVRVARVKADIFAAACELAADMPGWSVVETNEADLRLVATKRNGFLGGVSSIEVWVEGPDGIPNSTTHCASHSTGALLSRDRANVAQFIQKFWMRVT